MYHLKNCGLPNVWLANGYKTDTDKFGAYYSYEDSAGLYRAIAKALAHGNAQLSAEELRVIRRQLNASQDSLGKMLGRTGQTVLLWERHGKIPADAARQIKLILLRHLFPTMTLDLAFKHIEQPRPNRIVLARTQGQWHLRISEPIEYSIGNYQAVIEAGFFGQAHSGFSGRSPRAIPTYETPNPDWLYEFALNTSPNAIEIKLTRDITTEAPAWKH